MEVILSPCNLNKAYKRVMKNKGKGGIDKMSCEQLLPWLKANKDELIRSLMDGTYRPNPVRRVEIPKEGGKKRLLGIPTTFGRLQKWWIEWYNKPSTKYFRRRPKVDNNL